MTKYYVKAYYPQGDMNEAYEGEISEIVEQITNDLSDPENFSYTIAEEPMECGDPCTIADLKKWAK